MDMEVVMYQEASVSRSGSFVDWTALAQKIPRARLIELNKTNCTIMLPEGQIGAVEALLKTEFPNVRIKTKTLVMKPQPRHNNGARTLWPWKGWGFG